jgi:hypothetical protein
VYREYSPRPRLLYLEQHCDGRIVESGEEHKVDNVPDMFVYIICEVEDKTGGVRHVPASDISAMVQKARW